MFKDIDLLIGFVLLMLAAGTVVAATTQAVAALTGLRSRQLCRALEELLLQSDCCNFSPDDARKLASFLLTHPRLRGRAAGGVTHLRREDFVRLLIEEAAGPTPLSVRLRAGFVFSSACEARSAARRLGCNSLILEAKSPNESPPQRDAKAMVVALGPSPMLLHVHAWYGHAMARATERYMRQTRTLAAILSLALVLATRLDILASFRIQTPGHWPGLVLSWLLLSLGTPFWYDRLKDLLHFRPAV
ncbi:MAG TPA: hypothetical protein VG456_07550 [Candidatus Sulfopaludibacter sp.]|jgi:hypothetical protein|nr:hypothetical protein [Candidatus Sulfopaludibacter sp.]